MAGVVTTTVKVTIQSSNTVQRVIMDLSWGWKGVNDGRGEILYWDRRGALNAR